jgi:uncharacterized protein YerC
VAITTVAIKIVASIILLFVSAISVLEYNRVRDICRGENQVPVASQHDVINVIRNYRPEYDAHQSGYDAVARVLSKVRKSEEFQNDGYKTVMTNDNGRRYAKGGGWKVEEQTELFFIRIYAVDFEYSDTNLKPAGMVEVKCDVFDCGAIDLPNCLTLGSY